MKEYEYVRLENINSYTGWEIEQVVQSKDPAKFVDMCVISKHVEPPKDKKIEKLKKAHDKEIQKMREEIKGYEQERERMLNRILKRNDCALDYIEKELGNINIQENIVAKNELLVIKGILQGVVKNV